MCNDTLHTESKKNNAPRCGNTFRASNGFDKPLTLNKFAEGMESAMREFNHEYRKERRARGMVTNVELSESAEDWLPQTYPVAGHKE